MTSRASPLLPSDIVAAARRVETRSALRLAARVHPDAGEGREAIVTDVTTRGCRLSCTPALAAGAHVTLIVRSTLVGGHVAWIEDEMAGIEFGARLLPKTLAAMLGSAGSEAG